MASSLRMAWRSLVGRPPRLVCSTTVWRKGVRELASRTGTQIESGAFLLGHGKSSFARIEQFLFYDDIDPLCFSNGIVEFNGARFGRVWERCRQEGLTVVADVHVHPNSARQSQTDRDNPMIAEVGHLAIILPKYAAHSHLSDDFGVFEYLGNRRWMDHTKHAADVLHIGWTI